MNLASPASDFSSDVHFKDPIVIAGGGPVGVRAAQELSAKGYSIVLINAERTRPYNRVKLTPLLAGEVQIGLIYLNDKFPKPGHVDRYDGVSIVDIDRKNKSVVTSTGRKITYSKLLLALGSRANVPEIEGGDLPGVYVFRNFQDTEQLVARSMSARHVVVVGGGLLGLEAARGMRQRGAEVTVVEHESRLMPRQIDNKAGAILKKAIEKLGVKVITGDRITRLEGDQRLESVCLTRGKKIKADTVILCTGVRANTQLAIAAGIDFGRGITVNDQMRSSDPDIYAIGECAEHNNIVYGLVGPGYEQASAAVAHIAGENRPYIGSVPTTKLKVLGVDVFSIGDYESAGQFPGIKTYIYEADGIYRRIFVENGRLVAALGVGDWPEATRLQQVVKERQAVRFWNIWSFKKEGELWEIEESSAASWPSEAIVCNCTGVTKGAITNAITLGAASLDDIRINTSANSVCGTCKEDVLSLLGEAKFVPEPLKWWKWLLGFSGAAIILVLLTFFIPRIPLSDNFTIQDLMTNLWFDTIWKQYSGFTLLALTVVAALIGLRKRIKILAKLGSYDIWRLVHLGLGLVAALALVWHTGFRLGNNLNFFLMASFLLTLAFGAVAGFTTGGDHEMQARELPGAKKGKARKLSVWVHILALWPLPALLIIHILTVYTY